MMTKVTINMPVVMHDEMKARARSRGMSVTELMRRAVALDKLVFEYQERGWELVLRDPDTLSVQRVHVL